MLPLLKILTVIFKVFSKPLINHTKKYHLARNQNNQKPTFSKRFFVSFGHYVNIFESKVNRKFLNISPDIPFKIKTLKENDALEKGLEYFYEMIFYAILITLPLHEMYRSNKDAKVKSSELSNRLGNIETQIKVTKDSFIEESHKLNEQITGLQKKINETDKTLLETMNLHMQQKYLNNEQIKQAFGNSKIIIDEIVIGGKQVNNMIVKLNKQQEKISALVLSKTSKFNGVESAASS